MSNIGNFKRVGREVVYKGKILEFCQDEIQTSKGHHVTWDFLNHKGAAAIVPVMDDGKILMVKQWRNVVNRVSLEIPAGAKDTVEEPTLESCPPSPGAFAESSGNPHKASYRLCRPAHTRRPRSDRYNRNR